eukprot:5831937-Amphidinium_carterae.1
MTREDWREAEQLKGDQNLRLQEQREEKRRQAEKKKREEDDTGRKAATEAQDKLAKAKPTTAPTTASAAAVSTSPIHCHQGLRDNHRCHQVNLKTAYRTRERRLQHHQSLCYCYLPDYDSTRTTSMPKPEAYYEKKILQEMMQRSYIHYHPTTGYHKARKEIQDFHYGFEVYNFNNEYIPNKPIEEDEGKSTTLLSISY